MKSATLLLATGSIVIACAPPPPPPIDPVYDKPPRVLSPAEREVSPAEIAAFSNVSVQPDATDLPSERLESYRAHDAESILRRAMFAELQQLNRLDSQSEYWLYIRVTAFRLRSTSTSVWVGSMSGNDNITITADIMRGESVVRTFSSHVASIKGGIFFPSSAGRLNNLARALAKDVIAKIWTGGT